jgi:hypothetical protein
MRTAKGMDLGRTLARLAAVLAVFMFVSLGASHEMLHLDEPGAHAAAAHADPRPGLPDHPDAAHGCSAHCSAAHVASQPPAADALPAPFALHALWRPGASPPLSDLAPERDPRPPRV